ncbi:MAG: ubiquitin-like domain-containing protein, partial [Acidimicrobiia bacterium]|nr:ubiquitin-like domain-containing protein [Acidimicrobiia bacterium]
MISTTPQNVVPAPRSDIEILPDGDTPGTRDSVVPSTDTGRLTDAGRPSTGWPTTGGDRARSVTVVMLAAAALAAVVIGGFVYRLATTVAIDLTVDGQAQTIETRATTVADLLAQQEITVASDDLVIPAAEAELTDGATIVVRYARPLTVVIDGSEATHRTTELTVGAALSAVGAPVEGAAISLPLDRGLSRSGASVEIITAKSVTVDDGGRSATVTTTA